MKNRIYIYCFIYSFLLPQPAAEAINIEREFRAKSPLELEQTLEMKSRDKELKTLCFLQLKKKQLPSGCYEWLAHRKNISAKTKVNFIAHINERCFEASSELKHLAGVRKILKNRHLNPLCRKKIEAQKLILEYQLRDSSVEEIFLQYFEEGF